jgi:hypothetical protein
MRISTRLYSLKLAKMVVAHDSVIFDSVMLTKGELEEFVTRLKGDIEEMESVLEKLEYYDGAMNKKEDV